MIGRRVQQRIYLEGLMGRRPPLPVRPDALEAEAQKRMSPEAFAYVAGGAGLEWTMEANREAFRRLALLPRMLRGTKPPGLGVRQQPAARVDAVVAVLGRFLAPRA